MSPFVIIHTEDIVRLDPLQFNWGHSLFDLVLAEFFICESVHFRLKAWRSLIHIINIPRAICLLIANSSIFFCLLSNIFNILKQIIYAESLYRFNAFNCGQVLNEYIFISWSISHWMNNAEMMRLAGLHLLGTGFGYATSWVDRWFDLYRFNSL